MSITLTETAADQIRQILDSDEYGEGTVVRMGILGGGCSGLQYSLGFDDTHNPDEDAVYDQHGVRLVAKKKHDLHLDGTTIDFVDGPAGRGFKIDNPNYVNVGCPGCGGH